MNDTGALIEDSLLKSHEQRYWKSQKHSKSMLMCFWATLLSPWRIALLILLLPVSLLLYRYILFHVMNDARPELSIVLFGDSLVHRTSRYFDLEGNIHNSMAYSHPEYNIKVTSSGYNSNCIHDLYRRVYSDVLDRDGKGPPDAVIMYWDSDAVDVDEADQEDYYRANYRSNLTEVLTILTADISFVAFGGPTLFGEKPRGKNSKDSVLDAYVEINREVTAQFNGTVKYIETRDAFFQGRIIFEKNTCLCSPYLFSSLS